jgi:hypothetical protein
LGWQIQGFQNLAEHLQGNLVEPNLTEVDTPEQKMRMSMSLIVVGVALATAAPAPQDQRFFGVGGGVPGLVQPGFLGGVQPGFGNPGFIQSGLVQPGFLGGVQPGFGNPGFANPNFQQIQFNQAGQPCKKFSRGANGQYFCTESLEQIAPGAFNPSTSGFGFNQFQG